MVTTNMDQQDAQAPVRKRRYRSIKSSNYDISNTCNLRCEGCYYFVSDQKTFNKRPTAADYDEFFSSEVGRGVNYPVLAGGEPSLNKAALAMAARHWSAGIIYTNGARRIDPEAPFRIAISVWGARERNERLRGAASYDQALQAAAGDKRALIYFTISRDNIDDLETVVTDCVRQGTPISFQDFSMTTEYMRLLETDAPSDGAYFRLSSQDDNLSLRMDDRRRAADIIDALIDRHPEYVIYNKVLNDWVHRSEQIHTIDPQTGMAVDCAMLNASWHHNYRFDLSLAQEKDCCAPEFDCRDCRVGPVANFSLLARLTEQMRRSERARAQVNEVRELMMRFHFWDWPSEREAAPSTPPVESVVA